MRSTVTQDEGAVRKFRVLGRVADLAALARDAVAVQDAVERPDFMGCAMGRVPESAEPPVILSPAFAARPMAGGQRRGLVEKEEFGVSPRCHERATTALEVKQAGDPGVMGPAAAAKGPVFVVKDSAIAHETAARRMGDNVACRKNPVLQGHPIISLVADSMMSG